MAFPDKKGTGASSLSLCPRQRGSVEPGERSARAAAPGLEMSRLQDLKSSHPCAHLHAKHPPGHTFFPVWCVWPCQHLPLRCSWFLCSLLKPFPSSAVGLTQSRCLDTGYSAGPCPGCHPSRLRDDPRALESWHQT